MIDLICACDNCHYLFDAPELPEQCPDCGKWETRLATKDEQSEVINRTTSGSDKEEEWI